MIDPARALLEAEFTAEAVERNVVFFQYQQILKSPRRSYARLHQ